MAVPCNPTLKFLTEMKAIWSQQSSIKNNSSFLQLGWRIRSQQRVILQTKVSSVVCRMVTNPGKSRPSKEAILSIV